MRLKTVFPVGLIRIACVTGITAALLAPTWTRAETPAAQTEQGHHVHVRTTISYLRDAQWDLAHADKDFYGFRAEALKDVTDALKACHDAMGVTPDKDPKDAPDVVKKKLDTADADHPLLAHAMESLKLAHEELKDAPAQFEGHKTEAVRGIDAAVQAVANGIHKVDVDGGQRIDQNKTMTPQQRMDFSKTQLAAVEATLKAAEVDAGGHKAKAAQLVEQALKELSQTQGSK